VAAAGGPTVRIAPVQQCRQAQFGSRTLSILTLAPALSALSVVSLSLYSQNKKNAHSKKLQSTIIESYCSGQNKSSVSAFCILNKIGGRRRRFPVRLSPGYGAPPPFSASYEIHA
jgi:hypothetical protein